MQNITIITGATSGIGRDLARQYLVEGETVIGVAHNDAALTKIEDLRKYENLICVVADLSEPSAIKKIISKIPFNAKIKQVIHCAVELGPVFEDIDEKKEKETEINKTMLVNCHAPINLTKELTEFSTDNTQIVFMSSDYIKLEKDPKCFIVYAESKKELYNTVLHLHKELAEKVKIIIFNPGPTQTSLFEKFWKEIAERYSNKPSIPSSSDDVAKTLINSLKKNETNSSSRKEIWDYRTLKFSSISNKSNFFTPSGDKQPADTRECLQLSK